MYAVAGRLDPDTLPARWPAPSTPRWRWPASPASASSTTCTTARTARRTPTRTRWAQALIEAAARGRHPDHPARHLLPDRHGGRRAARRAAAALRRRRRDALGGPGRGASARRDARPHRRGGPLGARGAGRPARRPSPAGRAERGAPLHVHLSEQPAENEACLAAYGRTPTELLADARRARPAHHRGARHPPDRRRHRRCSATAGTGVCFCPTTERDLADGIGPARALADAGCPLSLGSDSHAVIDLFEEARAVELDERLRTAPARPLHRRRAARRRDRRRARRAGLGRRRAASRSGARADLVTVRAGHASAPPGATARRGGRSFAATAADVTDVVVDGRPMVARRPAPDSSTCRARWRRDRAR